MLQPERSSQEIEIRRRVIQHGGQNPAAPVKLPHGGNADVRRVLLQQVQGRHHRREDAHEQESDLAQGSEIELVLFQCVPVGEFIGQTCRPNH